MIRSWLWKGEGQMVEGGKVEEGSENESGRGKNLRKDPETWGSDVLFSFPGMVVRQQWQQSLEKLTRKDNGKPLHCINSDLIEFLYLSTIILTPEKAMAPHSSTLAWKLPWMEEPGRLQSMGSLRVGHNWTTSLSVFTFMHWRRKWQPIPVFLTGESQGPGSLVGCCLWGHTGSDTTEAT